MLSCQPHELLLDSYVEGWVPSLASFKENFSLLLWFSVSSQFSPYQSVSPYQLLVMSMSPYLLYQCVCTIVHHLLWVIGILLFLQIGMPT